MPGEAENGATAGKTDLPSAPRPLASMPSTIPCTRWLRDEARHGKAFAGLLKRYFG